MLIRLFSIVSLLWAPLAPAGLVDPFRVHEFTLSNGIRLFVQEDHRAPVAILQVWYKVGSADESPGLTGISHVLEHMMFKGTERYPGNRFFELIDANGGEENAFTSRDYTVYYELLEQGRLEIAFELEADRMRNLLMREADFEKERRVVMEERRMRTEDRPEALALETLYALAFDNVPYGHPIIGWMGDLEGLTLPDLKDWYARWYSPANARLVVVGDVDPAAIRALAEKHFGRVPAHRPPQRRVVAAVPPRGPRRAVVRAPARLPYLVMGYRTPSLGQGEDDAEPYVLDVISNLLDGGQSARLARRLVRGAEVAASAGTGYNTYGRYDGLFLIDGVPAEGHGVAELEQALLGEIRALREAPVDPDELERVKAQVVAAEIYSRDSISRQASLIGAAETIGLGWRVLNEYVARIQAVTPEQVQAVARKYLVPERRSVVVVEPLPIGGPARPVQAAAGAGEAVR